MDGMPVLGYKLVIQDITTLNWADLDADQLTAVAWAYYYFSIQFRENLEAACELFPHDVGLQRLMAEECNTANLSPWLDVARPGEAMDHDEFMRRVLSLSPLEPTARDRVEQAGALYLQRARGYDAMSKALSIASYEDGGLEAIFSAILRASHWETPLLLAFRHFLVAHIGFDSEPDEGHGALCRHLVPDDRILSLWTDFRQLLVSAVPCLKS